MNTVYALIVSLGITPIQPVPHHLSAPARAWIRTHACQNGSYHVSYYRFGGSTENGDGTCTLDQSLVP